MNYRLSANTIPSNYWTLAMGTVGAVISLLILVFTPEGWPYACSSLLLSTAQLYHALQYEITLRGNELVIAHIFGKPHCYSVRQFIGFAQTKRPYRPLLLLLEDGQQFAFYPKLKREALSFRYVPIAGFIEYWTNRLRNPEQAEGEVWPDDVIE